MAIEEARRIIGRMLRPRETGGLDMRAEVSQAEDAFLRGLNITYTTVLNSVVDGPQRLSRGRGDICVAYRDITKGFSVEWQMEDNGGSVLVDVSLGLTKVQSVRMRRTPQARSRRVRSLPKRAALLLVMAERLTG